MYGVRLGLEIHKDIALPLTEQIALYREVGFDSFFTYWWRGLDVGALRRAADKTGMIFQSIHAPSTRVCDMWYDTPDTADVLSELLECLRDCAAHDVPIMVSHAFCGFDRHEPTELGFRNFDILVAEAKRLGVRIALENTEGEEYLAALLERYRDEPMVGFCWDSGHEMCYTHRDLLGEPHHGAKLIATHLNDNLGTWAADGTRTGRDDLHLLPFDGAIDWRDAADRLAKWGYDDILTFELKVRSQPGRHENDAYGRMEPVEYITQAYMRCCRVAALYTAAANAHK